MNCQVGATELLFVLRVYRTAVLEEGWGYETVVACVGVLSKIQPKSHYLEHM